MTSNESIQNMQSGKCWAVTASPYTVYGFKYCRCCLQLFSSMTSTASGSNQCNLHNFNGSVKNLYPVKVALIAASVCADSDSVSGCCV